MGAGGYVPHPRCPISDRWFALVRSGSPETWTALIPCGWCGTYVPETESGRGRRWCSDGCRMKSYRAHKRLKLVDV